MSKRILSRFPASSSASILIVFVEPSQSEDGMTSNGTPVISPTPITTWVGPETCQPGGRLRTSSEIVVGAFP